MSAGGVQKIIDALENDDDLGIVVRGQTYIEASLRVLIETDFLPDSLDVIKWQLVPVYLRMELAVALGRLPREYLAPLRKLATLRNQFAHRPNHIVSEQEINDIINVLPPVARATFNAVVENPSGKLAAKQHYRLTMLIFVIILIFGALERLRVHAAPPCTDAQIHNGLILSLREYHGRSSA